MRIEELISSDLFVHQEHQDWLSRLNFYQDEIKFFQNELAMIIHKHLDRLSIIENVDEYKKLFLGKLAHIDELRHKIIAHERELAHSEGTDAEKQASHQRLREEYSRFVDDFELFKKGFKRFAAHND